MFLFMIFNRTPPQNHQNQHFREWSLIKNEVSLIMFLYTTQPKYYVLTPPPKLHVINSKELSWKKFQIQNEFSFTKCTISCNDAALQMFWHHSTHIVKSRIVILALSSYGCKKNRINNSFCHSHIILSFIL